MHTGYINMQIASTVSDYNYYREYYKKHCKVQPCNRQESSVSDAEPPTRASKKFGVDIMALLDVFILHIQALWGAATAVLHW